MLARLLAPLLCAFLKPTLLSHSSSRYSEFSLQQLPWVPSKSLLYCICPDQRSAAVRTQEWFPLPLCLHSESQCIQRHYIGKFCPQNTTFAISTDCSVFTNGSYVTSSHAVESLLVLPVLPCALLSSLLCIAAHHVAGAWVILTGTAVNTHQAHGMNARHCT